jgi:hypothetical protein
LALSANGLDDDDARHLADMLQMNHTLRTLDLDANRTIGEDGWHALADALRNNRTLTELQFDDCDCLCRWSCKRHSIAASLLRRRQWGMVLYIRWQRTAHRVCQCRACHCKPPLNLQHRRVNASAVRT